MDSYASCSSVCHNSRGRYGSLAVGPGFPQISLATARDFFSAVNQVERADQVRLHRVSITDAPVAAAMSPGHDFRNNRPKGAKKMVKQTDLTPCDIAVSTGLGSANNLTKVFKVMFGKLPREFRKLAKGSRKPTCSRLWAA